MPTASSPLVSRASAPNWLILFALVWSQFSMAAHPFVHSPNDVGEVCAVCLQADRDGEDLAGSNALLLPEATKHGRFAVATFFAELEFLTLFRARASP